MGFFSTLFGSKVDRGAYNSRVNQLIRDDFGFEPDNAVDSRFPGILAYYERIDEIYHNGGSPEFAALRVMVPLFSGLFKSESIANKADAKKLFLRIQSCMKNYLAAGKIDKDVYLQYSAAIKKHTGLEI